MAKYLCNFAAFMALLILITGMLFCGVPTAEARHHKHYHLNTAPAPVPTPEQQINCSSDAYCDPFAAKIDSRCMASSDCQEKCNQFGGVFTCSDAQYCKCQIDS